MESSTATPTLLHAILKNQSAIARALHDLAEVVDRQSDATAGADSVREPLRTIRESEHLIGSCVAALMR